jgi:hypothetical protein
MVEGFNWEPLYERAMEQDFNYLHFWYESTQNVSGISVD